MSSTASSIVISFQNEADSALVDEKRIERLVQQVLTGEGLPYREIGIVFTRHEHVTALNRDFLGHDYETDVLSFLLSEAEAGIEGEVYVDVETAAERHAEFATTLTDEIERYVVHGVLHLSGHNDDTPDQKEQMHLLETKYLDSFE